jgi:CRISPR-associated protein Cmr4
MATRGTIFYRAIEPVHPGSGIPSGVIDNAVQRESHTRWPMSGVKGAWRSLWRQYLRKVDNLSPRNADEHDSTVALFGRDVESRDPAETVVDDEATPDSGALAFPDARILLFPVRSASNIFALVTCPMAIRAFTEQAAALGGATGLPIEDIDVRENAAIFHLPDPFVINTLGAFLEDVKLTPVSGDHQLSVLVKWLEDSGALPLDRLNRIAVVHDTVFEYFVKYCTYVAQRNRLNFENKTVESGALFVVEYLPPETVLYSTVFAEYDVRSKTPTPYDQWKPCLPEFNNLIGLGGDASTGKGWCKVSAVDGA